MLNLRYSLVAAALALAGNSAPASAETFTVFVYETPAELLLRADKGPAGKAYWDDFAEFAEVLAKAGAMRGGAPLALPSDAISLSGKGPEVGLPSQSSPILSGYFQIEAPTLADAEKLASKVPSLKRGGRVELRASYPAPTMMMAH